jgi:hypothetical protein
MSISKRHHSSRNPSSRKHRTESTKALRKAAQQRRVGPDGLQAAQFQLIKVFARILELWMLACGMKQKDNWVPLLIEEMRQKAAGRRVVSTRREG